MSSIKLLQDVTVYNSITAVSGVTVSNLTVLSTSNIPDVTTLKSSSANWNTVYSTVQSSSADWSYQGSDIKALTSNWENTYSVVQPNSANWDSAYNTLQSNSASFATIAFTDGKYLPLSGGVVTGSLSLIGLSASYGSFVGDVSATYFHGSGSLLTDVNDQSLPLLSANWESTYNTVNSNSANWDSVYTTVKATSTDPVFNTLTVTSSATLGGVVGIGTTAPDPNKALYVVGDVLVYGNLSANGTMTFANTLFTTTSALSIVNTGTGPALLVSQEGDQAIAAFYDHAASGIALWVDGAADRPGFVGVKTDVPNKELTVVGDISATGKIYSSNTVNKFVSAFGDGTSQSFVINHNLGTRNVVTCVIDNSTYEVVVPSLVLTTPNTITIETAVVPNNAAYTLTVIG